MKKNLTFFKDVVVDSIIVGSGVLLAVSGIACYVGDISKYCK